MMDEFCREKDKLGKFDGKSDEGFFVGYSLSSKAFRVYNIRTRKVQENLHVGFLENKPIDKKGLFLMILQKDASYFGDASPNIVDDATEESHDGSNIQNNGTADQQVNTARQEVNTGSREVSTAIPEVNIATPEDLLGPIHTSEDTQVEDQVIGQIGTKWVYRNKKDERGIVIRNKARLVAQGHTQEEGIDYDEVFAPVARIEAIRQLNLMLLYWFTFYQMVVKIAFLYGQIEEEVHGFQEDRFQTLSQKSEAAILLVQIYVDDIIFGSTKKELCDEFEKLMKDKFQMSSMGELTFFLGLQYSDVKSASTPTDLEKPLVQDGDAANVDEHLYRSMIGSLMYPTTSRPYIIFVICACARFQVSPKISHLLAVKRIFRYLKGKPSLGLWYSKDSSLELVAYIDGDYARATLDRKSTTGGCQFLGNRLISWQCKKQTVVATSTTEAEYVAAASCCGQVLWIQNQLLDYGYNFMNTVIYIDNTSTICIIENPVQHSKTKHIEIRHHFIRDCNAKKLIQMAKIDTQHNVADLLTKGFDAGRFQYLVSSIGMLNP
ncbi:putative ribonuclease H-like domain-containing protein [Tanacetum coccineum]